MKRLHFPFLHLIAAFVLAWSSLNAADNPKAPKAPKAPSAPAVATPPDPADPADPADPPEDPADADDDDMDPDADTDPVHGKLNHLQDLVEFSKRVTIRTNETARNIVVFFENAVIDGRAGQVVVIGGNAEINGRVNEDVVTVLGKIKLGPNSRVGGQVVGIGGGVERADGAKVKNENIVSLTLPGADIFQELPQALTKILTELVLLGRPLSFQIGWVWSAFAIMVLVSLTFAAVFPKPMERTIRVVDTRMAGSLLMGLSALPLALFVFLLLAATGIGLFGVPFLMAGLVMATLFGKAAVAGHIGTSILRQFGLPRITPLLGILAGSILIALFYVIPFIGLISWMIASTWGTGAALLALFSGLRDESPQPPASNPPGAYPPPHPPTPAMGTPNAAIPTPPGEATLAVVAPAPIPLDPTTQSLGTFQDVPQGGTAIRSAFIAPPTTLPRTPEALTSPRASFWRRMGAVAIDFALLSVLMAATVKPPLGFALWIIYFTAMWFWRSTTIGGLVLGLRVVRLDDRPMDLPTALVRALGGALGTILCFLGLIWCAWDPEKQGWHDKMAGTVVIRTNTAQPLI